MGASDVAFLTNGAMLSGFTLTNGYADQGRSVWCTSTNAVVSNCILIGNSASLAPEAEPKAGR